MIRKIKYGFFIAGLLLCCLFAGCYFGYCQGKGVVPEDILSQSTEEEEAAVTYNKTIAIVNLDEGTERQGEQENYGIRLIDTITDDVVITGLEDARRGIESGTYSAYMVIPAAFSEQVCTIAAQPVKSEITYALGSGLTGEEREETIYRMESIFQLFNNNLSKVYLSSVLAEYHDAQDSASSIIYNDTEDMELLLQIRGENLIEYIETPQVTMVENDIPQLDLTDYYTENSQIIERINASYEGFNEKGTEAAELLKEEFSQTEEKIEKLRGDVMSMEEIVEAFDSVPWDDSEQAAAEDAFYQAKKEALTSTEIAEGDEGEEGDGGEEGDEGGTGDNGEAGDKGAESSSGEAGDKGDESSSGEAGDKGAESSSGEAGDKGDESSSGEAGDKGEEGGTGGSGEEGGEGGETEGGDSEKKRPKGILTAYNASLEEEQEKLLLAFLDGLREETALPEEDEQETYVKEFLEEQEDFPTIDIGLVDQEIDALIQAAKDSRTLRNEELKKEEESRGQVKEQIQEQMETIGESGDEVNKAYEGTKEAMTSFDLTSFIDDAEIDGYLQQMKDNLRDMERKAGEQAAGYEEYASDVYEATDNDIRSFEEEIVRVQEQSEKKLEQGLEEAKNSRQENNENNLRLLHEFMTQMPYTRIGEVENREVYDFIAEPIITNNLSETERTVQEKEGIKPETVIFIAVFCGLILLLGGVQIVAQRRRAAEEEE